LFLILTYFLNLMTLPSPAERGANLGQTAPLSAGEGSGVRFWDVTFPKKKLLHFIGFPTKQLTVK
jgi:hypothetical protein